MGILKTLLSLPHLADDLESEESASAKLFGKIADLEKKIEKLEAGEPRPITKEELEKVAAADEFYRRVRHWNEKYY